MGHWSELGPLSDFGLDLAVIGLGLRLGLMKYMVSVSYISIPWSQMDHLLTVSRVLLMVISGHFEYFTRKGIVIVIDYTSFIISNM